MYEIYPTPEIEYLEELEDDGDIEEWGFEDLEELADLDESDDWELEALRRRRRPVRVSRRPVRRPVVTRRRRMVTRRPRRTRVARRRPVAVTRRRAKTPLRRSLPRRVVRRRTRYPRRRRKPIRVVRRYIHVPYPRYYPDYGPPVVSRKRPAVVLSGFVFERASLRRHHLPQIRRIAGRIVDSWRGGDRPIRSLRILGHTDNRGSARFNRRLGMQRARAARDRLVREINRLRPGLTSRITISLRSLGETRPIASNRSSAGRARNRRVEIFLSRM
jgi:outer membrane protein OmpA-like peptidoglycan-associated protein